MNLYSDILNIPEEIIRDNDNNINHILSSTNSTELMKLNKAVEIVNKFHSYFHFEQSYAYLIVAYLYGTLSDNDNINLYLDKAIFQDHTNSIALDFTGKEFQDVLDYDKAIKFEDVFLDFAVGLHDENREVQKLDSGMILALNGDFEEASNHSYNISYNSHRLLLLKSIIFGWQKEYNAALEYALKAAKMLEKSHKDYHQYASNIYRMRAAIFEELGKPDLAKNDIIKAQDLVA